VTTPEFTVRSADWSCDQPKLKEIRFDVFCVEQRVPEALEWDGIDGDCLHAIAEDRDGRAIGCGRLLPDGHVGRMAVLAAWRGRGVGSALLDHLVALARSRGDARVMLNAQTHALPFYERHGFVAVGEPFDEAGIPHRAMERALG
jgi:predicted GNAT family N-acyltransferase